MGCTRAKLLGTVKNLHEIYDFTPNKREDQGVIMSSSKNFQESIDACIRSGKRFLEDAEWLTNRESTGVGLAMLAQEEFAKAFVLALVRDGILPWTDEARNSLRVHECKHLVTLLMEWLHAVNELRFAECSQGQLCDSQPVRLRPDVAIAMNIYRHEMIERIAGRTPEQYREWGGPARRVAKGKRDRKKQAALYVDIADDGRVASEPAASGKEFGTEFGRAEKLMEFAMSADRNCIFAYREYELFRDIFRSMFEENPEPPETLPLVTDECPDGIPGVVLVKTIITVAEVFEQADS